MIMKRSERKVRAMTKAERRAYLPDHGWYRLGAGGSETWFAPGLAAR
jgi:hypothetical protein